jgi:hypothetical protein
VLFTLVCRNLINFLLTNPNERYLNPSFGGGIRRQVFEQITAGNLDALKLLLTNKINRLFHNNFFLLPEFKFFPDVN